MLAIFWALCLHCESRPSPGRFALMSNFKPLPAKGAGRRWTHSAQGPAVLTQPFGSCLVPCTRRRSPPSYNASQDIAALGMLWTRFRSHTATQASRGCRRDLRQRIDKSSGQALGCISLHALQRSYAPLHVPAPSVRPCPGLKHFLELERFENT